MSGWNIDFNKSIAEAIGDEVKCCKHLAGFDVASNKLKSLKSKLEGALFDAEWWASKCDSAATHYEHLQKQYNDNPADFSASHAQEVNGKSPQTLSSYAAALKSGADKLRAAIESVGEMLSNLERAKDDAVEQSKAVADKIFYAVELMDKYLHVEF